MSRIIGTRPIATDQRLHRLRREFLAVLGAGGARDAFVHQRAAHVVGTGVEAHRRSLRSHLHPGRLDVGDQRVQRQAGHGVHQDRLAQGWSLARQPRRYIGASMCTNGSGTNSVKPPVSRLQVAQHQQMPRPVQRALDVAVHDGGGGAQAKRVRGSSDIDPLLRC